MKMTSGQWEGSVLCVSVSALMLFVDDKKYIRLMKSYASYSQRFFSCCLMNSGMPECQCRLWIRS